MLLENRVVVVTGAGRNIGAAIARRAVAEGAAVAALDVDSVAVDKLAAELSAVRTGSCAAFPCDVSSGADVERTMREVASRLGGIHVLVNNVAVTDRKTVLELEEDEWDRVLTVSLKSVFLCSKYAARAMIEGGAAGAIVNLGSTSGYKGRANATAYTAAKAGVLNLTRSLAVQLGPHGIRVNSVTPNKVGSPVGESEERNTGTVRNLRARNGVPDDVAGAVLFLASDQADFITGADLLVDGGASAPLL